jgi:16S rRNA G966 N2-methylase RsmD
MRNELLPPLLELGGIFVLEKSPGEALPDMQFWHVLRHKRYGATEVLFLSNSAVGNQKSEIR